MEEQVNQEPQMSAEELEMRREQMMQFYVNSTPYLQTQLEYEELLLKLDEIRFKRANIQMQFAMMMQEPDPNEPMGSPEDLKEEINAEQKRKLKKN
jgi:hypothetical protein